MSPMKQKFHRSYYIDIIVSEYLSCNWQDSLAVNGTKMSSAVFIAFSNHDTSNIPNLSNLNVSLEYYLKQNLMTCFHIWSQIIYFHIFLVMYLVYIFLFLYVVITHLLQRGGGVGIYCQFIPDWIESTQAQISFPAQCRLGIQNQIRYTNWRSILI